MKNLEHVQYHFFCNMKDKKLFESTLRQQSDSQKLVAREVNFDGSKILDSYPEYSPYYDIHMKEYWMSPLTRKRLANKGMLSKDRSTLIDPDRNRLQLNCINKRVIAALEYKKCIENRRWGELLVEAAWLKRKLVNELKHEDLHP